MSTQVVQTMAGDPAAAATPRLGRSRMRGIDWPLLGILATTALLCLYGIQWGRVESWNSDQMSYRYLFSVPGEPFNPAWFYRPPFHTYLLYVLVHLPLDSLGTWLGIDPVVLRPARLVMARLVTLAMFLGTIWIGYRLVEEAFDRASARIVAAILGTSAGLVMHAHFLTVDIPLAFWILWALREMTRIPQAGGPGRSVSAGLLLGLATATKYNGALLLVPLVTAHWLLWRYRPRGLSGWTAMRRLALALGAAALAFLLANPYSVLDAGRFLDHLTFNAWMVPRYEGAVEGHGVLPYLAAHPQLLGWPVAILAALGLAAALGFLARRGSPTRQRVLAILALGLILPYAAATAWSPRVEARFVLPVLPVLLLLLPFLWRTPTPRRLWLLVLPVLAYNLVCAALVGNRLLADPRMAAQTWMQRHGRPGDLVLSTLHAPHWSLLPGVQVTDHRLPVVTGRQRLLQSELEREPGRAEQLRAFTGGDDTRAFRLAAVLRQGPRLIAVSSGYYDRFLHPPMDRLYPEMEAFFRQILAPPSGYRVAFDGTAQSAPAWAYPAEIPYLARRLTILERIPGPPGPDAGPAGPRSGPAWSAPVFAPGVLSP